MKIELLEVKAKEEVAPVAALADEIWRQHFTPIIGADQVAYMLEHFQSADAIASQIRSGTEYYIAAVDGRASGYLALIPNEPLRRMMISKIYVRRQVRQTGIGHRLLSFAEDKCSQRNFPTLWLTVNRFNSDTVAWYHRKGFEVTEEVKKDIGGGFFMDDFIMTKRL